ncbi:MAG: PIG-L deacetylase family protein [Thermodesulfobacteriota bacterium]
MKILALGAHADDVELGCGGTLIKHVRRGDEVTVYVLTDSAFMNVDGQVVREREECLRQAGRAAEMIGARLIVGDFPTNNVLFDEDLVKALRRVLEKDGFDLIYTHWTGDVHLDHANIARATLSAARHVASVLMYRSNWYLGDDIFAGRFFVDIGDVLEEKLALLKCYASEYERRGRDWVSWLKQTHALAGLQIGAAFAEAFEVVRYAHRI